MAESNKTIVVLNIWVYEVCMAGISDAINDS